MEPLGQTPTDAYYAGYIDADGCIRFSAGSPRIEVKSVFPWVLEQIRLRFGGSVLTITLPDDRPTYRWAVSGDKAIQALMALRAFLIVKRTQADLVLEARAHSPGPARDGIVAQISALKHHGYHQ